MAGAQRDIIAVIFPFTTGYHGLRVWAQAGAQHAITAVSDCRVISLLPIATVYRGLRVFFTVACWFQTKRGGGHNVSC